MAFLTIFTKQSVGGEFYDTGGPKARGNIGGKGNGKYIGGKGADLIIGADFQVLIILATIQTVSTSQ